MTTVDAPADTDLRAEAHRVAGKARELAGAVPPLGSEAWWSAPPMPRIASLLTLAEAWVVHDPDRAVVERLKACAVDLAGARHWSAVTTSAEMAARRAELGPMAREVDREAAERWAATGSSEVVG